MQKPIKILLLNAINETVEVERRYPNLGLGYLISAVRMHITEERIEFLIADRNIPETIKKFQPNLVGISSVTQNYNIALKYSCYLCNCGIPHIFGGIHITTLPETLPKSALAACLGESEMTFVDIVQLFIKQTISKKDLYEIYGIAFWDNDTLVRTKPRPLISDMNTISFPARDQLEIHSHTYMFTSRGCPYRCSFCSSSRFWDKLRLFSAEYVVDEIELLVSTYRVKLISFFDDLFVANRNRLKSIIRILEERCLLGKVKFTCSCRANVVDKELASLLFKMGVVSVGLGLESGDEETLQYLKGNTIYVKDNINAINSLKDAGIAVNGSFIIGSPKETGLQIMRTYNFIKNSRLDLFDIYILTPYPSTPIWEYALNKNLVSDNMIDWSVLDVNTYRRPEKCIILSETLSRKEIIGFYKKFRRLRLIRNIRKIVNHPLKKDLPRMAWNYFIEMLTSKQIKYK